jgi:hypothetical protein
VSEVINSTNPGVLCSLRGHVMYKTRGLQPLGVHIYSVHCRTQGQRGPSGVIGLQGARGERGGSGPKGDAGVEGPRGSVGPAGGRGDIGAAGEVGEAGPKGDRGNPGANGANGVVGVTGQRGPPGAGGARGQQVCTLRAMRLLLVPGDL